MSTSSPTTLSLAIERYEAAKIAWHSQSDAERDRNDDPAFDAMCDAEHDLATTATATDGELVQKMRYLLTNAVEVYGAVGARDDFGSILAAMDFHFSPDSATGQA